MKLSIIIPHNINVYDQPTEKVLIILTNPINLLFVQKQIQNKLRDQSMNEVTYMQINFVNMKTNGSLTYQAMMTFGNHTIS